MDRIVIVLIIARNGLDTAQGLLTVEAIEADRKANVSTDEAERKKLLRKAASLRKLCKVLATAEAGLNEYLKPSGV